LMQQSTFMECTRCNQLKCFSTSQACMKRASKREEVRGGLEAK